jgi:hypothetical protein
MADQLVPSHRVGEADWYGASLNGFGGRVDQVVPRGYPAYARILHPATDVDGKAVRWSDVATWTGRVLHPVAQFHALAGRREYDRSKPVGWPGEDAFEGSLRRPQLRVLCEILARHTARADRCWLTVWEGYGNLPPEWERTAPRVHQPERAYYLFLRPLAEVVEFSAQIDPASIQSPSQWWPQDRAWCVASEIDFDSTLVAGSEGLVADITGHPDLEAFAVKSTDDLTFEGDRINPPPPAPKDNGTGRPI